MQENWHHVTAEFIDETSYGRQSCYKLQDLIIMDMHGNSLIPRLFLANPNPTLSLRMW